MSTESIKKLVQYENEAKEMLDEAYSKYDAMKKQAKEDAKGVVMVEIENNERKIKQLGEKVDEYIKIVEENKKEEFDIKISKLRDYSNKLEILNELMKKVCKN